MKKNLQAQIRDATRDELKRLHGEERWNHGNMFEKASKPAEAAVYLDNQPNLSQNPQELLRYTVKDVKMIKALDNSSPAMPHVTLIDLKLNVYGPVEDDIYATFPVLIKNVRRGNTILRIESEQGSKLSFGRKGLEKFFDLRYEHVSPEQRYDDKCLSDTTHMHKNYILGAALRTILEGGQVEVLKTLKANGENVQVSWN